ncbi:hypothetical protein SNEBB_009933 [Seison nebaliae]|nr:hypothetical protein SNEBB_009933 [Seison nebaliae]
MLNLTNGLFYNLFKHNYNFNNVSPFSYFTHPSISNHRNVPRTFPFAKILKPKPNSDDGKTKNIELFGKTKRNKKNKSFQKKIKKPSHLKNGVKNAISAREQYLQERPNGYSAGMKYSTGENYSTAMSWNYDFE